MPIENMFDDSKTETGAAFLAAGRDADPIEALGQSRQVLRRNARAIVADRQDKAGTTPSPARLMGNLDADVASGFAVLQGVLDEILQELDDFIAIAADHGRRRQLPHLDASAGGGGDRLQGLDDMAGRLIEVDLLRWR